MAAQQRGTFVGVGAHIYQVKLHAGGRLKGLDHHVGKAAHLDAHGDLSGVLLAVIDQLRIGAVGGVGADIESSGIVGDHMGPHSEALVGVVAHAGDIVDQQGIVEEEDGVAVWGGLMNLVDAAGAAGAGDIDHHKGLSQLGRQFLGQNTGQQIGTAPGAGRDNNGYRAGGPPSA